MKYQMKTDTKFYIKGEHASFKYLTVELGGQILVECTLDFGKKSSHIEQIITWIYICVITY